MPAYVTPKNGKSYPPKLLKALINKLDADAMVLAKAEKMNGPYHIDHEGKRYHGKALLTSGYVVQFDLVRVEELKAPAPAKPATKAPAKPKAKAKK